MAGNADLHALLQREETWLSRVERTVSEVRAWREREAQRFWPGVIRRWAMALLFALASAWSTGAGYAYVANTHADELGVLRARAAFVESIEDRVVTMTPAERRQFDALMRRSAPAKR